MIFRRVILYLKTSCSVNWKVNRTFILFVLCCRWTWMSWTSRWSRSRRCLWRSRRWWRRWAVPTPPTRPSWPPRDAAPICQSFPAGFLPGKHLPAVKIKAKCKGELPTLRGAPQMPTYCHLLNTDHYMFHSINRDNEFNFDWLLQMLLAPTLALVAMMRHCLFGGKQTFWNCHSAQALQQLRQSSTTRAIQDRARNA